MSYKKIWESAIQDNKQVIIDINSKYLRYTTEYLYELGKKEVRLYDISVYDGDVNRFLGLKDNYTPLKTYNR